MRRILPLLLGLVTLLPLSTVAQDLNIILPIEQIERSLGTMSFEMRDRTDTRFEGDRTQRVVLIFEDSSAMMVKWGRAPRNGAAFNNQPRYETAAYLIQKMFLEEPDYVVPPTVIRSVPVDWYRSYDDAVTPTFDGTESVVVALQYWLSSVSQRDVFDPARLDSDTVYARHFGNLNLLTHLIRHGDSNDGNVLISTDPTNPRLFAVDNGVAFAPPDSNRGTAWRDMRTRRVPHSSIERLRGITRAELDATLGVIAQFEIRDGLLVPVPATANLAPSRGVRRRDDTIQFGLTAAEIRGIHGRMQRVIRQADRGRLAMF